MGDGQHYRSSHGNDKNLNMDHQANLLQTLHRIPWFNELSPVAFEKLSKIANVRNLDTGEVLI